MYLLSGLSRGTRALAFVAALSTMAPNALADLYAVDSSQDQLFRVNPSTGAVTLIGSTSSIATPADLAWNGSRMYSIDLAAGGLYTIDLATGASSFVGNSGINGWQALAARPSDGALFAINQDNNLYSISSISGARTLIGPTGGTLITAARFDASGTLWGIEFFSGQIGTVNVATGGFIPVSTTIAGFQGLAFDSAGVAYITNTNTDSLYTLNLTTGTATLVGPMTGTGFVKGLEFNESFSSTVPEPTSVLLLSLGSVLIAGRSFVARGRK